MLADHGGEFEPVQFGHADIDQDNGDFVLEQEFKRFASRGGGDEIFSKLFQNDFIGEQLRGLIVDQKDVYLFVVHHRMRRSAVKPHAYGEEKLLCIDRLGQIVGGACLQTLLPIALHGLGGEGNDGEAAK